MFSISSRLSVYSQLYGSLKFSAIVFHLFVIHEGRPIDLRERYTRIHY